ncbi:phosphomevalonate kinase [Symbioplanes lichenis]|uniref:phosphomevalonate kinase n=1 Tax=Symbioplanes lichenis TaxID=1629072 RepID=UPI00273821AD|nr:phosphomevalonate kinase [Actinoplanes lichenis]
MSGRATVRRHAPGKLFIAGEYAVVEPGHPAILVAVDRRVTVSVSHTGDAGVAVASDLWPGVVRARWAGDLLRPAGSDEQPAPGAVSPVLSAVSVTGALLRARGIRLPAIHVSVGSDLHRDGTKFGLGSSGAVTVATVTAVAASCGVRLSPEERYRLALLATAAHDPRASGGDIAASVWGGWLAYHAPDRAAVADLAQRRGVAEALRVPWPGFGLRRLRPPRALTLQVGWTGEPASTVSLTKRLRAGTAAHRLFLDRSDACVRGAIHALDRGAGDELRHHVRTARQVLAELDGAMRLGIFTERLTALCDAAEAVGAAAKPSGAGGGDCGIALLTAGADTEITRLHHAWVAAGVLPVPIRVEPSNGSGA